MATHRDASSGPARPHHLRISVVALALLASCGADPARPQQAQPSKGKEHPTATTTRSVAPKDPPLASSASNDSSALVTGSLDCAECRPMRPYEDCGRHLEYDCPAPRSATCGISRLPDPCDPACCAKAGTTR